ncbi:hypothetical protein I7I48_06628 [Histoplasma ohiense]|nr:hypothetical protein I7I48_06628 [Histoplasma ohiense (nom. inval.)]
MDLSASPASSINSIAQLGSLHLRHARTIAEARMNSNISSEVYLAYWFAITTYLPEELSGVPSSDSIPLLSCLSISSSSNYFIQSELVLTIKYLNIYGIAIA